jgi:integrase
MKSKLSIDQVVALVRDGKSPKPPEGKSEIFFYDPAQRGFGIRVLRSGVASWFIRHSIHGRQKRVVIGDVLALNRKTAIEAARKLLAKVQLHRLDPQEAKREALAAAKMTFEVVAADFLDRKRKERKRSGTLRGYQRYLTGYYFEPFHKRPFDEISSLELEKQINFIETESGNETAHSCHSLAKDLFEWAARTGRFPEDRRNPLTKVDVPVKNRPRERVLTSDEIRRIWKACDDWEAETLAFAEKGERRAPGGFTLLTDYPRAVQLLLLTGMRAQEVGDLHWKEINLDHAEICLDGHRTKSKRELCIPLSDMAVEILCKVERRPNDPCIFGRGDGRPVVLDGVPWKEGLYLGDTVPKLLKRLRRGDIGFWKHELDPEKKKRIQYLLARGDISMTRIRIEEQVNFRTVQAIKAAMEAGPVPETQPAQPMDPWRMHDLRRTFRTGLSECGVDFEIAERLVGHLTTVTRNKTASTYDRYEYWPEKTEAVKKWQDRLRSILDGTAIEVPRSKSSRKAAA